MAMRKEKLDITARKILEMLTENTGRAMCDSGDFYGRNWQHNQGRNFGAEPSTTLSFKYGCIDVTHNLYHWLRDNLDYNPTIQRKFTAFSRRAEWKDEHWLACMEGFTASLPDAHGIYGEGEPFTVNTYNGEDLLSQIIQYRYWTDEDGAHVLLQIHGGCDARGGYTAPKAFDVNSDSCDEGLGIFDNARAGIYCTGKTRHAQLTIDGGEERCCNANWSTDDGYHYYHDGACGRGAGKQLETYELREVEDVAAEFETFKDKGQEERAILVDSEGNGYCPYCGSLLAAGPF